MTIESESCGSADMPVLVPARMLNEFSYCPRLFYLEWVQGEFEDSADTIEGRYRHRNVQSEAGDIPSPGQDTASIEDEKINATSVLMSSEKLKAIARIDILKGEGRQVRPVDYKRGKVPDVSDRAYEPERVQLCLQGLILQDNGYTCDEGILYYVESKQRVTILFDEETVSRTLTLLKDLRKTAEAGQIPPPLVDSPKCPRCSLVGICLPDEVNTLRADLSDEVGSVTNAVRRLIPARDDDLPVYIQAQGSKVAAQGDILHIHDGTKKVEDVRLLDTSQLSLFGNVQITAQAIRLLCNHEIPICHFSYGGWFYGVTHGIAHKNVELRRRQYAIAEDLNGVLPLAKAFVRGKIQNCRTMLRRNYQNVSGQALNELVRLSKKSEQAHDLETLLGIEGAAARVYFSNFAGMLKPRLGEGSIAFNFTTRNRRPPRDLVNALLSYAYAILVKDLTVTLSAVGFDPYMGFYHRPRYGRPALALDLMEEFRPLVGDSIVISVINNGEIGEADCIQRAGAVALTEKGRKKFLQAYERRINTLITHPIFGYKISYRRAMEVQARLLGRYLSGEIKGYPPFRTR